MTIRSINKTEIVRVKKDKNYTTINNTCLRDDRLSWKAKGMMAYLLTLPDDWNIYLEEVMKHSPDGEKSFRSGLNELKKLGYVERVQIRDDVTKSIIGWQTIVNEVPQNVGNTLLAQKVDVGKVDVGKQHVGNEGLLSTDVTNNLIIQSTDNTKDIKDIVPLKQDSIDYEGLVNYLNFKTGKNFRHKTVKTRDLIRTRINEGFVMEDFKTVIDNKTEQWLNDPERNEYLRPETLFGNKFEGYLNQSKISNVKQQKKIKPWEAQIHEYYRGEQNSNDNHIGISTRNEIIE